MPQPEAHKVLTQRIPLGSSTPLHESSYTTWVGLDTGSYWKGEALDPDGEIGEVGGERCGGV